MVWQESRLWIMTGIGNDSSLYKNQDEDKICKLQVLISVMYMHCWNKTTHQKFWSTYQVLPFVPKFSKELNKICNLQLLIVLFIWQLRLKKCLQNVQFKFHIEFFHTILRPFDFYIGKPISIHNNWSKQHICLNWNL